MSPFPAVRAAALAVAATLVGCPLPQPLPAYPDSGRVPSPRILTEAVLPNATILKVASGCPDPVFQVSAAIVDDTTTEAVVARWFIDYDTSAARSVIYQESTIQPPPDGVTRERAVPPYAFQAYSGWDTTPGVVHVVELVVSNGFAPEPQPPALPNPVPNRTPLQSGTQKFETQSFRWVFHYEAGAQGDCGYP